MRTTRLLTASGLIAGLVSLAAADRGPIVETATVDGIIHPVSSEFMRSAIAKADADGAALVVFTLHTPGGLLDSTRDINNAIIAAKTPVAVFVGPAGYRAASAGFLITIAADIAAMAPGTHIGAAHPVSGNGEKVDEVMAKKMASDTAAYARTLATQRGRNVPLVEQAVTESRSFTEQEALDRHAAAHRPRRHRRARSDQEARRPDDQAVRRRLDHAAPGERATSATSR